MLSRIVTKMLFPPEPGNGDRMAVLIWEDREMLTAKMSAPAAGWPSVPMDAPHAADVWLRLEGNIQLAGLRSHAHYTQTRPGRYSVVGQLVARHGAQHLVDAGLPIHVECLGAQSVGYPAVGQIVELEGELRVAMTSHSRELPLAWGRQLEAFGDHAEPLPGPGWSSSTWRLPRSWRTPRPPRHMLVVAGLSTERPPNERHTEVLTTEGLDERGVEPLLRKLAPTLALPLEESCELSSVTFHTLSDFRPDMMARQVPSLSRLLDSRSDDNPFEVDGRMAKVFDRVLVDRPFRDLECSWTLVSRLHYAAAGRGCRVHVLPYHASPVDTYGGADFEWHTECLARSLHAALTDGSNAHWDGGGFDAVVTDLAVTEETPNVLALLTRLAEVSSGAGIPLLAGADSATLGRLRVAEVAGSEALPFGTTNWAAFRASAASHELLLCSTKGLLRAAHDLSPSDRTVTPRAACAYEAPQGDVEARGLFAPGGYVLALTLLDRLARDPTGTLLRIAMRPYSALEPGQDEELPRLSRE